MITHLNLQFNNIQGVQGGQLLGSWVEHRALPLQLKEPVLCGSSRALLGPDTSAEVSVQRSSLPH